MLVKSTVHMEHMLGSDNPAILNRDSQPQPLTIRYVCPRTMGWNWSVLRVEQCEGHNCKTCRPVCTWETYKQHMMHALTPMYM